MRRQPLVSAEAQIALACARASLTPDQRARLSNLLAQPIDWPGLIRLAERHGLLPLVSHHLTASFGPTLPAWVREELHDRARTITGRNLRRADLPPDGIGLLN